MTVALITGANSGIGRSAAVDLAAKGWTVYGSMRSSEKGEKLAAMCAEAGVEVHPVICDVTDTESVNRAVAEVIAAAGHIDVLVNNAGIGGNGVCEETSIDEYKDVMDVNLYGVIRGVQAVLPHMRERGTGCIINVSSIAGVIAALAQSPYVASKWALEGLTEGLAQEVVSHGIRVALIEPGIVKTAIMAKNTAAPNASGPMTGPISACSTSTRPAWQRQVSRLKSLKSFTKPQPMRHQNFGTPAAGVVLNWWREKPRSAMRTGWHSAQSRAT